MAEERLGVDVAGAGELVLALAGGVPARDIVLHGNAKSDVDIEMAVREGVGLVVVDNFDDIDRLERMVTDEQAVLVRLIPGIRAETHAAIATGHEGSKFGLSPPTRERPSRACAAPTGCASTASTCTSARRSSMPSRWPAPPRRPRLSATSTSTTWAAGSASATRTPSTRRPSPTTSVP